MEHPSGAVTRAEKELQRRSFILTRLIEQSREQTHNKPQSLPQELSTKPSKLSHQNSCPRFHSLVSSSSSLIRDDEDGEDADLDHLQSLRDEIRKLYTKHNLSLTGNRQGDEVAKDVPAPSRRYGHKGGCKSVVPVSVRRNGVNKVPCEVDIGKAVVALKVRVKAADMPSVMQDKAFKCARESLDSMVKLNSKKTALALKREFDTAYGPAWHCIVGTSFGSFVTHSLGGFLYFSIDKVSILLFKTAVEPLDQ